MAQSDTRKPPRKIGARWADDPAAIDVMQRKVPRTMRKCAELPENQLDGPWVLRNCYTVADAYLFTVAGWLEADGVDTSTLPRLLSHRTRMNERHAVRRALAEEKG